MKKKEYKIKVTKKLIKQLKPYFKEFIEIEDKYYKKLVKIEEKMAKLTGIDIDLFMCDGEVVGIGNHLRTMRLIHREELE